MSAMAPGQDAPPSTDGGPPADPRRTDADGRLELAQLRQRLQEAEDTLRALRSGEVDAIVVGEDIYTLEGAQAVANRFRADVLAQMDDAVVVLDPDDHVTYLNPAAERQYGLTASQALGLPREHLYRLEWLEPGDEAEAARCLHEVGHWRGRNRHRTRHGETLLVESTWSRLQDQHTLHAGSMVVIRDVSRRAAAEAALRDSRARLAFALESASIGEWEIDLATGTARRSARHDQCFGHASPVDDWDREIFLRHVHPDDREAVADAFDRTLRERGEMHFNCRVIWPDASEHWIEVHGAVFDDESRPGRMIGTVTDVTARMNNEAALRDADQRKDEFLATLAHELRNPLAPIRNSARLMRLSADVQVHERALAVIERQLDQLVHLVDDLLDVSRISRGKIELRRQLIDVAEVIRNAVDTSQPLIDDKGHALQIDLPEQPLMIEADMTRLTQVVSNLLNNAAKYTPPGGRITVSARLVDGMACLSVSDTGIGIPAGMLPHVFELFTQVDRTFDRSQGGLGIGLALVRQLIAMHGGSVESFSAGENQGTTIVARLPAAPGVPAAAPSAGPTPDTAEASGRVLVVDDNADVGDSLAELLEMVGYQTAVARNGNDAIALAASHRPRIALVDIGLPDIDGHEVARRLRADPQHQGLFLIALTGWGQEDDRRRSREAGFDQHLVKPVDIDRLLDMLNNVGAPRAGE